MLITSKAGRGICAFHSLQQSLQRAWMQNSECHGAQCQWHTRQRTLLSEVLAHPAPRQGHSAWNIYGNKGRGVDKSFKVKEHLQGCLQVRSAKLCQKLRSSCPTGIWVSRPVGKGAWIPLTSKRAGFVRLGQVTLISASPFLLDIQVKFRKKYFRAQAGQFW